ncbi:hypothetical protein UlMin_034553 [Ulmus minor]
MAFSKPLNPYADPFYSVNILQSPPPTPLIRSVIPVIGQPQVVVPYGHYFCVQFRSPVIKVPKTPHTGTFLLCREKSNSKVETTKEVSKKKIVNRRKWIRKEEPRKAGSNIVDARIVYPFFSDLQDLIVSEKTTVMIKNIPNQFSRRDLLRILSDHCCDENRKIASTPDPSRSEFDFVYLPMDFRKFWDQKKVANLGYAFVNFTSPTAAWRFFQSFNGLDWGVAKNNKICDVVLAKIQGIEALEANFVNKVFYCHSDQYLPAKFVPPCDGSVPPRPINMGRRYHKVPPGPVKKPVAASS